MTAIPCPMHLDSYMRVISGDAEGPGASLVRASLSVLSGFFILGWAARKKTYDFGLVRPTGVGATVVSIGNITAGGTGKTPATIYYARRFSEEGHRVVVLSRGYGRTTPMNEPLAVSDGKDILLSPDEAGDEPYLIAKKLPRVPVVVCGKRVRGALFAMQRFEPDVVILDDGFQHIALSRDEDIVVIDCTIPFGFGHLLPRGLLREPLSALRRATGFLLTHADGHEHEQVVDTLRRINPTATITKSRHRPVRLVSMRDNAESRCDSLGGKRVLALSSIGNPKAFEETLIKLGADVVSRLRFRDHHWYDGADSERIQATAERSRADYVVTTEKDGVRLALPPRVPGNTLVLEVELELIEDRAAAKTAWDIAKRIEQEMTYPGEVKVTLIRELRAVEYAR